MKRFSTVAVTALLVLALSAIMASCSGGGGGGSSETPQETLFASNNAWSGDIPANAKTVTPDEFRSRYDAGELQVVTPASQQAQRTARQNRVDAERAFLGSKSDISDEVKALLAQASAGADIDGDAAVTLPDGQTFALIDLGTSIEKAAENYRLARDPAAALASYSLSYSLLTDELKAQVPAPDTVQGNLDQIKQATLQLNAVLATVVDLDSTRLDPDVPPTMMLARALSAGNGADNTGTCTQSGYAGHYWFPLRSFVAPVKNQGERGTCWAFAAIAAVESRERVQNDNPVDLSEQFLINKVKLEWSPDAFNDGGDSGDALNAAWERNQLLMPEALATYNSATGRPDNAFDTGTAGTAASYKGACAEPLPDGYTGDCSETAHQSQPWCVNLLGRDYCGYQKMTFNGPGVEAGVVRPLWQSGDIFALDVYRYLLSRGVPLLATFPVYVGFMSAPSSGIVSDYAKKKLIKNVLGFGKPTILVDGTYGMHEVLIIGFISNEQLSFPGSPASNVGGGGYFIVRNSWGCRADGGYYYVPADYVSSLFTSLEFLSYDSRRSASWYAERVAPGGTADLDVDPGDSEVLNLRVKTDLASTFAVRHPVASYVRLTVTSDRDGMLYDGQWLVNPPVGGSLFANSLPVNFQTEGTRTLTITASYGTQVVGALKLITVVNTPPVISFLSTDTLPHQGENFFVTAHVSDINEAGDAAMCTAMTWSVTPPDVIVSGSGCTRSIKFGATGDREVRAATHDREGSAASHIGVFNVAPPSINPYPQITTFGVYSRDYYYIDGVPSGCASNQVADSAVIDLRQIGCNHFWADVPRYFSKLVIENPTAEALSYDWTYSVYSPVSGFPPKTIATNTATPNYDMNAIIYGALDAAYVCTLDVRVNAPEPSRTKSLRVWTGQCINLPEVVR